MAKELKDPMRFGRHLRNVLVLAGLLFFVLLALAFTAWPWRLQERLAFCGYTAKPAPDFIVLMGGGGIPSESGLIRSYYAAQAALHFPSADVIIAMPAETNGNHTAIDRMVREFTNRGVPRSRLRWENEGRHTREQALKVRAMVRERKTEPEILIVSSPEHMKRCVLSFRRAGFQKVHGAPALEVAVDADLHYDTAAQQSEKSLPLPDFGNNLTLRYRVWDNLGLETRLARELLALAYYKVMGWI